MFVLLRIDNLIDNFGVVLSSAYHFANNVRATSGDRSHSVIT
jgi:hypothetical protein